MEEFNRQDRKNYELLKRSKRSKRRNEGIEELQKLNQNSGAALVLVTHDPELATRCQHHIELHEGQILKASFVREQAVEKSVIEKFIIQTNST